jgi:rSAM/selenodomain-associated transferase 2
VPACARPERDPLQPAGGRDLPTLAIVVPVYHEAATAAALLDRLAALTACELVVVDGGSSDGTAARLAEVGDRPALAAHAARGGYRVVSGPRGRPQQMNHGAGLTTAEVLVFLHADTTFTPAHAAAVQRAVAAGADLGCFALQIDSADARLQLASRLISLRSRLLPSATGDQAIYVRRTVFAALGGYRELPLCEDLDFIKRAHHGRRFVCLRPPVHTSARRWEQRGVGRTILLMWLLRLGAHAGVDPATLKRYYEDVR